MSNDDDKPRNRTASSAFAVLAVFCLNLLLPPCAVAMGEIGERHDCPHCPPSHAERHAGHEMRDTGHAHHAEPAEVTAPAASPCAGESDCGMLDDLNVDLRQFSNTLDDLTPDSADAAFGWLDVAVASRKLSDGRVHASRSPPPTPSDPLNLLYCVWLD